MIDDRRKNSTEYYRNRLTSFFSLHDPSKLENLDQLMLNNKGKEEELLRYVHGVYGVRDFESEQAVDEIFENERYSFLTRTWGSSYPGHMLVGERKRWSTMDGTPSSQNMQEIQPTLPRGWEWETSWQIDKDYTTTDDLGWCYAFDFSKFNSMLLEGTSKSVPGMTDYTRRRRWIRTRRMIPTEQKNEGDNKTFENNRGPLETRTLSEEKGTVASDETLQASSSSSSSIPIMVVPKEQSSNSVVDGSFQENSSNLDEGKCNLLWEETRLELNGAYDQAWQNEMKRKMEWKSREDDLKAEIEAVETTIEALEGYLAKETAYMEHGKYGPTLPRLDLENKIERHQRKLDYLKRALWIPQELGYRLRLSFDGIFLGLKDFWLEKLACSFRLSTCTSSNVKEIRIVLFLKGSVIFRGHDVKIIGEKGTRVPNANYNTMFTSTDFDGDFNIFFHTEKKKWVRSPDCSGIKLHKFRKQLDGGVDLPQRLLKVILRDLINGILSNVIIADIPPELVNVLQHDEGNMDVCGEFQADGPSIKNTIDAEFVYLNKDTGNPPSVQEDMKKETFVPLSRSMNSISQLLGLNYKQMNMLVSLNRENLAPDGHALASLRHLVDYYNQIIAPLSFEECNTLCQTWQKMIELMDYKYNLNPRGYELEVFSFSHMIAQLDQLCRKTVAIRMCLSKLELTCNLEDLVSYSKCVVQNFVNGIHRNDEKNSRRTQLYGISFGRKVTQHRTQSTTSSSSSSPNGGTVITQRALAKQRQIENVCSMAMEVIETIKSNLNQLSFVAEGQLKGGQEGRIQLNIKHLHTEGPINLESTLTPGKIGLVTVTTSVDELSGKTAIHVLLFPVHSGNDISSSNTTTTTSSSTISRTNTTTFHHCHPNHLDNSIASLVIHDLSSSIKIDLENLLQNLKQNDDDPRENDQDSSYYYEAVHFRIAPNETESTSANVYVKGGLYSLFCLDIEHVRVLANLQGLETYIDHHLDEWTHHLPAQRTLIMLFKNMAFQYLHSDSSIYVMAVHPHFYLKYDKLWLKLRGIDDHPQPFLHFDLVNLMDCLVDLESIFEELTLSSEKDY